MQVDDFTKSLHCKSHAHCFVCRTDPNWRQSTGAPETCPHEITTNNIPNTINKDCEDCKRKKRKGLVDKITYQQRKVACRDCDKLRQGKCSEIDIVGCACQYWGWVQSKSSKCPLNKW